MKINQADRNLHLPSGILRASETVRNLGVITDQHLTFEAQACACSKACFYHLRRIRQIKRFIDDSSLQLLVQTFTTTRLDYCNGLLVNCSVAVRKRMQQIQDSAARLVCSEPARSRAAPLLHRLHWLPVGKRITYKLCVLMFDVYHGTSPVYLTDLCSRYNDHRLRSSARGDFVVRRARTRLADSSFTIAGLAAWNSLPVYIRTINNYSFCRQLKTYLFSLSG